MDKQINGSFQDSHIKLTFCQIQDMALHVDFFMSYYMYCDVTIAQLSDRAFDFKVLMKKSAKRCHVRHLAKGQLWSKWKIVIV